MHKFIWLIMLFPVLLFAQDGIVFDQGNMQPQILPQVVEPPPTMLDRPLASPPTMQPFEPARNPSAKDNELGVIRQAQQVPQDNGFFCKRNSQCKSGYCADKRRCAPLDGTGIDSAYCHHDNHCASKSCNCRKGASGFCFSWERWPEGSKNIVAGIGFCNGPYKNGSSCNKNSHCTSGHCANGQRCAPKERKGGAGAYCHHDNHCGSKLCICPGPGRFGSKSWGFCANWERFSPQRVETLRNRPDRARGKAFMCL